MLAAYHPEDRELQDSTIYLVSVTEQLIIVFRLLSWSTQEVPLLEAEFYTWFDSCYALLKSYA